MVLVVVATDLDAALAVLEDSQRLVGTSFLQIVEVAVDFPQAALDRRPRLAHQTGHLVRSDDNILRFNRHLSQRQTWKMRI